MSEINARMQEIRSNRQEYRRQLEQEHAEPPVVISRGHAMKLDLSFRRDPERWRESYVELTATKLHKRAVVAQNGLLAVPPPGPARWGSD